MLVAMCSLFYLIIYITLIHLSIVWLFALTLSLSLFLICFTSPHQLSASKAPHSSRCLLDDDDWFLGPTIRPVPCAGELLPHLFVIDLEYKDTIADHFIFSLSILYDNRSERRSRSVYRL